MSLDVSAGPLLVVSSTTTSGDEPWLADQADDPAAAAEAAPEVVVGAAADSLVSLWDDVVRRTELMAAADWALPTPDPGLDVRDVVLHLTTLRPGRRAARRTTALQVALRETRDAEHIRLIALAAAAEVAEAEGLAGGRERRMLGAACLDLFVHVHDLASALQWPSLTDDDPVALESCRYLMPILDQLATPRDEQAAAAVRLSVPGLEPTAARGAGTVPLAPAALVLMLRGRLRGAGAPACFAT